MRALAIVLLWVLCSSCGGDATSEPAPGRSIESTGIELFEERVIGANPGCVTCHSLQEGITLVGPSLFSVASPVDGMTAAQYIEESILDPDGFVVDGFSAGQMNGGWGDLLSPAQVDSLVSLLTGP